jgi:hypothetical protein
MKHNQKEQMQNDQSKRIVEDSLKTLRRLAEQESRKSQQQEVERGAERPKARRTA